jgi:hypothetical protein
MHDIIAAIIGGLIAIIPFLIPQIREWLQRKHQRYKFMYVKFHYLRRKSETTEPIYKKYIRRLDEYIDVYDEVHSFRLNIFDKDQKGIVIRDRSSGVVDLNILYPWQSDLIFPDEGAKKVPHVILQTINQPSRTFFTRAIFLNGFQYSNEDFAMKMEEKTKEARMIVDFSSIESQGRIFNGFPKAYHRPSTTTTETAIGLHEIHSGIYAVNHNNLEKDDVIVIRFDINWDEVDKIQQEQII